MTRQRPARPTPRYRFAAFAVVLVASLLASPASQAEAQSNGPIDTSDRQEVASSYQSAVLAGTTMQVGWTGSIATCTPGPAAAAYDNATLNAINWYRHMAGVDSVRRSANASAQAELTALMMHANNGLSHFPTPNWPCYTSVGADVAALSNLTLGVIGSRGVSGQIEDPGASNAPLGHRRWLLFPRLAEVGIANTDRASVISVLNGIGTRDTSTNWIAWPPAGFVPNDVVFPRWSLSFNSDTGADFSQARVSMTENGRAVAVDLLPIANGFGDNTLGWEPRNITPTTGGDKTYRVTVSNIRLNGNFVSHTYETTAFDVTIQTCLGRVATIVGTNGSDVIHGTNGVDVILALDGNDIINGLDGNDVICAGGGNDEVDAGHGNDLVLGGQGHDILRGGSGNDIISGQTGRDRIAGNAGADVLAGGSQRDVLLGNTGSDECWGDRRGELPASTDDLRTCESGN